MWSYMAYSFFKETQGILSFQLLYTCKKKNPNNNKKQRCVPVLEKL